MFELTDEQREIQRLARDFAEGEVRPIAEEIDREKREAAEVERRISEIEQTIAVGADEQPVSVD